MKKAITIIVAVLFVFAFTSISFAVEENKVPPVPAEKKEAPLKVKQITGEVKAVDTRAMTITVAKKIKDRVMDAVVTINNKTKITCNKDNKTFADVKVGNKVTVKYIEKDGKNIAKGVAIKIAATAEKKAEPAK
ncbi:MAG: hypothetical protein AB1610_11650 [Nitrospirota bacterium]